MENQPSIFPFGILASFIVVTVMLITLLLSHPSNISGQVSVAEYLYYMGIFSFILLFIARNIDTTSLATANYSLLGFIVAFTVGMGGLAMARSIAFANVDFSYIANLSVTGLPNELFMLLVATTEEFFFRVALPLYISKFLFILPREAKWFGAILVSSAIFGYWHVFAYSANANLIFVAAVAGFIFSLAYRMGSFFGGGDLAFAGIIAGHYYWNLSASGLPTALPALVIFSLLVLLFIAMVNPRFKTGMLTNVASIRRAVRV
ncbi:MAG: type II CAAX prenyl endopeptidase Rce1 family protein [Candidatus Odinarchaeota archaeon]